MSKSQRTLKKPIEKSEEIDASETQSSEETSKTSNLRVLPRKPRPGAQPKNSCVPIR
ncbi:MAG: hypothetical protein WCH11_01535 [Bdellovibrio sp.]